MAGDIDEGERLEGRTGHKKLYRRLLSEAEAYLGAKRRTLTKVLQNHFLIYKKGISNRARGIFQHFPKLVSRPVVTYGSVARGMYFCVYTTWCL